MAGIEFWDSGVAKGSALGGNGDGGDGTGTGGGRTINATFQDHPWDIAFIGGDPVPGICEVLDGITEIGIDNKNPDGKDGSAITVKGYRPGPFIIACTVWTDEQWGFLQALIDKVWRRPKKRSRVAQVAVAVQHPALDLYGINSGALTGITFPRNGPFEGSKTVSFKFIENTGIGVNRETKTSTDPFVAIPQDGSVHVPKNVPGVAPSKNHKNLGLGGPKKAP